MIDQRVGTDVGAAIFRLNLPAVGDTNGSTGYVLSAVAYLHTFITSRVGLDTDDTDIVQRGAGVGARPIGIAAIDPDAVFIGNQLNLVGVHAAQLGDIDQHFRLIFRSLNAIEAG